MQIQRWLSTVRIDMKRLYAFLLTAALLVTGGYASDYIVQGKGASTKASQLSRILKILLTPCSYTYSSCRNPYLDVVFALDASSSINSTQFQTQKDASKFIATIVNIFRRIRPGGSRVGALTFADDVMRKFELNEHTDLASVIAYIDAIDQSGGLTNGKLALETAQLMFEEFFVKENVKLIWLLTDGVFTHGSPRLRATHIKKLGWFICVIGIGNNVNDEELKAIASPGCYFKYRSFPEYLQVVGLARSQLQTRVYGGF
ncbi:uncharacterized protein LOC106180452 isoform X1 [Lingula anatina]|uniref:Uncharacterized protein LOC106180452 isoform X1 n=1 Tax=Lingula anatina TaxID=7574 RepID=A0A1S3KB77_LINAN|nr:uncharacterized protein LOC106180452 isoform X1 [Lingula anatina]|eukprot:XP_013419893.1 uncharacterized protein LOC106180452 isoform X1 [Lingula anatina]